jgi:hypothetical protein
MFQGGFEWDSFAAVFSIVAGQVPQVHEENSIVRFTDASVRKKKVNAQRESVQQSVDRE